MRPRLRLLQVCNVGEIVGGTAACAWSIIRSLPGCDHHVAFLGPISAATREVFADCRVSQWPRVTRADVARCDPDVIILHNTPASKWDPPFGVPTIRYVHSLGPPGNEDRRWYCSRWLAEQCHDAEGTVLLQSVPRPPRAAEEKPRELRAHLVVGRLCTPQRRKWPRDVIEWYRRLAARFPGIAWEFVSCPASLQSTLTDACRDRATFHPAGWEQRRRLWEWNAMLYHHPTLTESFGRTAAEAMRAGCIPIVDARGGFTEQIVPHTGFLCHDLEEFAEALQTIDDPHERQSRSETCRHHADRKFSFTRFAHDLHVLLQQVAMQ